MKKGNAVMAETIIRSGVLYLAGPISGVCDARGRFDRAEHVLVCAGWVTINPAAAFSAGMAWRWYMERCLPLVAAADGVALLDGWEQSRGARIEARYALLLGLPVRVVREWVVR